MARCVSLTLKSAAGALFAVLLVVVVALVLTRINFRFMLELSFSPLLSPLGSLFSFSDSIPLFFFLSSSSFFLFLWNEGPRTGSRHYGKNCHNSFIMIGTTKQLADCCLSRQMTPGSSISLFLSLSISFSLGQFSTWTQPCFSHIAIVLKMT